jgi:hypothetical protein
MSRQPFIKSTFCLVHTLVVRNYRTTVPEMTKSGSGMPLGLQSFSLEMQENIGFTAHYKEDYHLLITCALS